MKHALLLALLLSACENAKPDPRPVASAEPPASAASLPASASAPPPAARTLAPPGAGATREARERAALDLLGGRAHAADLPLADVDPGASFQPLLRFAMTMPMSVRVGAIAATDLDDKAILAAVELRRMRLRICYGVGLRDNPNLQGRVGARVVVKAAGKPIEVVNGGSDMPDSRVVNCVLEVLRGTDLPAPRAPEGSAFVPVMFSPD